MADVVDSRTRSRMMAGIRGRDTRPEMAVRKALFGRGLRYRLNAANLPGRPDIVLPKHRAVVFVHGCFWHRHDGCRYATTPATRPEFWQTKFGRNIERDVAAREALLALGWRVATVWECATRRPAPVDMDRLEAWIRGTEPLLEVGAADLGGQHQVTSA